MEPGDVVGVRAGEITLRTADADRAMVVSRQPVVAGNDPGPEPPARQDHEQVASVGQAPVNVRGPVHPGDVVVPSGQYDGTAHAVPPETYTPDDGPIVGRAWEADSDDAVTEVTVAVGLETGEALGATVARQQDTIDELETENDHLRERLDAVEDRLASLESGQESPAIAGD